MFTTQFTQDMSLLTCCGFPFHKFKAKLPADET